MSDQNCKAVDVMAYYSQCSTKCNTVNEMYKKTGECSSAEVVRFIFLSKFMILNQVRRRLKLPYLLLSNND